ncbi:MAG: ABC transporter substrate-binding protein [Lachnospiraceae bacterium]|nr:ABC transporter substrate-binding protein [Lachnospiraceae bacterium]
MRKKIRRYQLGYPTSVDPIHLTETVGKEITDNVYEKLIFYKAKDYTKFVNVLAEDFVLSKDGMSVIFYIRRNVFFHDGSKLNAEAVYLSLIRMIKDSGNALVEELLDINSIKIIDNYTIKISALKYSPGFIHIFALQEASIISPSILKKRYTLGYVACGTGPFYIEEVSIKNIRLLRNNGYWRTLPQIEEIDILFEDDIEIRKDNFLRGVGEITIDEGVDIEEYVARTDIVVENNMSLDMVFLGFNLRKTMMQNLLVREAITKSFNSKEYIKYTRKGYGVSINGLVPKGLLGYSDKINGYEYTLTPIKESIKNGLIRSNLTLLLPYGNGNNNYIVSVWIPLLKSIGINVNLDIREWTSFLKELKEGNFDLFYVSWAPDYPDPDNYVYQFVHSKGLVASYCGISSCYGSFIDGLIEDARKEKDEKLREEKYITIQNIVNFYHLYIPLHQTNDIKVYRNNVIGVTYNALCSDYDFYPIDIIE